MRSFLPRWTKLTTRNSRRNPAPAPRRPLRVHLKVEDLEDRAVPSTLTVTNLSDTGTGSLRAAIAQAQNGDTITFSPSLDGGTIQLTTGQLVITQNLTITGPGANLLSVSGTNDSRVFDIVSSTVTISGLTITGGSGSGSSLNNGGGIWSNGNLTLAGDTISGNHTTTRFGVLGGGIYNGPQGTLTVLNSTVSGNQAWQGGGIYNDGGTASVLNSTVAGNTANSPGMGNGGGIVNVGTLALHNATVAGNTAQGGFGSAGGGIENAGTFSAGNTIVAGNTATTSPDLEGAAPSGDHNLIGGDAKLGPLQNNGGTTQTMALLAGSPALDAGTATGAPATDQRGVHRTGGINLGAYQASASALRVSGYPASIIAGISGSLEVMAVDPYGNLAPGYRGTVYFSSTDPRAVLPAGYTFTAADNGSHAVSITLKTAGAQALTATDSVLGSSSTQSSISVVPAPARSVVLSGFPVTITTGTPGALTVTLQDAYGNLASGYRGTVHFYGSDPQASLPADYAFTAADGGSHTFSVIFNTAGVQTVAVTDTLNGALTASLSATFNEFAVHTANSSLQGIAADGTGNLWFTDFNNFTIGRLTPTGLLTEFPLPSFRSAPYRIAAGPDGNVYFTEPYNQASGGSPRPASSPNSPSRGPTSPPRISRRGPTATCGSPTPPITLAR